MSTIQSIVIPAIEAPLDSVVVYRNAAEFRRKVDVQVDEVGEYYLEVQILQQSIRQDSVRVELAGMPKRGSVVTIIEVQTGYSDVVKAWHKEFEELAGKIILDEKRHLMKQQHSAVLDDMLDEQHPFGRSSRPTLEQLSAEFKSEGIYGKLEDLAKKIRQLTGVSVPFNRNQKPSDQLDAMRQALCNLRLNIRVHISVEDVSHKAFPMKIKGSIRYITDDCYWRPLYDLQIRSDDLNKIEMSYLAHIAQDSKEDWDQVKVALHTGQPSGRDEPLELPPLVAEFASPASPAPVRPPWIAGTGGNPGVSSHPSDCSVPPSFAAPPHEGGVTKLMSRPGGIANEGQAVFDLSKKLCIPSDNKLHRIVITTQIFETKMILYCTPEISCDVFRAGTCTNDSDYLFLAGPVSVFWDDEMVASTNLNTVNPGESFHLFFGKEQLVRLVVLPPKESPKSVSLGEGCNATWNTIKRIVHVNSNCEKPVNVMAVFRLPCSTDSKIQSWISEALDLQCTAAGKDPLCVSVVEYETDAEIPAVLEGAEDGTLLWVENKTTKHVVALAKLAANGKTTLVFVYCVQSPQGTEVIIH